MENFGRRLRALPAGNRRGGKSMEKPVLTVFGRHQSEKVIERSRFLAYAEHVESEEEARAFLSEIRKEHSLATHCCYAFIADKAGNLQRFSDDGEPQGTAGMPILEVLKNKGLSETAVAVVRYFGGIKLGAGGLVRAYSSSASENLAGAAVGRLELCAELEITVDYPAVDAVQKFCSSHTCSLLSCDYAEKVRILAAVKKQESEGFEKSLVDCLQGRVSIVRKREYYLPFRDL